MNLKPPYRVLRTKRGLSFRLQSQWRESYESVVRIKGCTEVEVNDGFGASVVDIEFLRRLPAVKSVVLLSFQGIDDQLLGELPWIEAIVSQTAFLGPLDVSGLSNLRVISVGSRRLSGLGRCTRLEEAILSKIKPCLDLADLPLDNLRQFTISDCKVDNWHLIERAFNLQYLNLAYVREPLDFTRLPKGTALKELELHSCKKQATITGVERCQGLQKLVLSSTGEIESLRPISALPNLDSLFFFGETNVIDGEVKFLDSIQHLKEASFMNRPHYDCKREDLRVYSR